MGCETEYVPVVINLILKFFEKILKEDRRTIANVCSLLVLRWVECFVRNSRLVVEIVVIEDVFEIDTCCRTAASGRWSRTMVAGSLGPLGVVADWIPKQEKQCPNVTTPFLKRHSVGVGIFHR